MNTIDWLLNSDPAIRWQAMRDLTNATPDTVAAERMRVSREGLGAQILAAQGPDGPWHLPGKPDWLPTLFTFLLLRSTGVDPSDPLVEAAVARLEAGYEWDEEFRDKPHKTFFEGETEPCINGGTLALGGYFGRPSESLMRRLLAEQLEDGGWNCEAPKSPRSSFHSTICVLEGLLEYERATGGDSVIEAARKRGEEYFLQRALFRRLSTGDVVNPEFLELAFPPRYRYDVIRGLDYLRSTGRAPDARIVDAVHVIEKKRQADGRWILDVSHDEALAVPLGETVGASSRWNTLRALRVLRWAGSTT